jgi:hypothetical protein
MVWCLALFFIWPGRKNIVRIPIIVFILTCVLEFLQLWNPGFLFRIRSTLLGMAILGTDFVWLQFPFYILGTAVSILLLWALCGRDTS